MTTLDASRVLAETLAARHDARGPVTSVTWVNHWSLQQVLADRRGIDALGSMSLVGIDGTALALLLGRPDARTSADALLPELLPRLTGARVAVIGAAPENNGAAAVRLGAMLGGDSVVVASMDGYGGLEAHEGDLGRWVASTAPTVVVIGLGAVRQERVAEAVAAALPAGGLVITCGGYLDQVIQDCYYPRWAYPLHLNWLVRLVREPSRLWRRYTVDFLAALVRWPRLRATFSTVVGYERYLGCLDGGVTSTSVATLPSSIPVSERIAA